jgi:hypothetical protein
MQLKIVNSIKKSFYENTTNSRNIFFSLKTSTQMFCHSGEKISNCLEIFFDEDTDEVLLYINPMYKNSKLTIVL